MLLVAVVCVFLRLVLLQIGRAGGFIRREECIFSKVKNKKVLSCSASHFLLPQIKWNGVEIKGSMMEGRNRSSDEHTTHGVDD